MFTNLMIDKSTLSSIVSVIHTDEPYWGMKNNLSSVGEREARPPPPQCLDESKKVLRKVESTRDLQIKINFVYI